MAEGKEALGPGYVTVWVEHGASVRALSLEDAVGLKARAWHDRFVIRDIIDLHAVASSFSYADLEALARRHEPDLDLETIMDHLAGVSVFADEDFAVRTEQFEAASRGELQMVVHELLPLEQAVLAHQKMDAGEVFGRIVLVPSGS